MNKKQILTAMALFLFLFTSACSGSSPGGVVKAFYKAVEDGNSQQAVGYFSDRVVNSFGLSKLEMGVNAQTEQIRALGGVRDVRILNETVRDNNAVVNVEVTYRDGSSTSERVSLVKEDGKWKIDLTK
jgi:hypothetical protein